MLKQTSCILQVENFRNKLCNYSGVVVTFWHCYRFKIRFASYRLMEAVKLKLRVRINTRYNSSRVVEIGCVIITSLLRSSGSVTALKCVIHNTNFAKNYNWNDNYVTNYNVFVFCAMAQSFGTTWHIVTEFVFLCFAPARARDALGFCSLKEWIAFAKTRRCCCCDDGKRNPVRRKSVAVTFQCRTEEPTSADDMLVWV